MKAITATLFALGVAALGYALYEYYIRDFATEFGPGIALMVMAMAVKWLFVDTKTAG